MKEAETTSPRIKQETIGRIVRDDSGRSFNILEILSTEQGTFSLQGEHLQPFSSGILKAIQSGYVLKDCADEVLRSTWRRLEREVSGVFGASESASVTPVNSTAPETVPEMEASPASSSLSADTIDEVVPVVTDPVSHDAIVECEASEPEPVAAEALALVSQLLPPAGPAGPKRMETLAPVSQQSPPAGPEVIPFPLRDRRSPESPDSEEIRLRVAARDREMDQLRVTFAVLPPAGLQAAATKADETPNGSEVFVNASEEVAHAPAVAITVEVQAPSAATPMPAATEMENKADPFALF